MIVVYPKTAVNAMASTTSTQWWKFLPVVKKEKTPCRRLCDTVLIVMQLQTELLVELSNAAAGIDQLLLASEEGVTLRADFHLDILLGRTCLNHITAGASNSSLLIIGMDSFLHARVHPLSDPVYFRLAFTPQKLS